MSRLLAALAVAILALAAGAQSAAGSAPITLRIVFPEGFSVSGLPPTPIGNPGVASIRATGAVRT
jgi:hypothetical protein